MEGIPKVLHTVTWSPWALYGLCGGEFALFDPFHKVPRALISLGDFLDAIIKVLSLGLSDQSTELCPVFWVS